MLVKEILMVNSKAKSDKISVYKRYHQLDWRKKDTILEWAARYEIENDEILYQSLQKMKVQLPHQLQVSTLLIY